MCQDVYDWNTEWANIFLCAVLCRLSEREVLASSNLMLGYCFIMLVEFCFYYKILDANSKRCGSGLIDRKIKE